MAPTRSALAGLVALAVALTACGDDSASEPSSGTRGLDVVAAFYPLQFAAERVGGDRVSVQNLTPVGAEPHDVELTSRDIATVGDADLVVYLPGFSPAVDDAIDETGATAFDVTGDARLTLDATEEDHAHEGEAAHDDLTSDPHFWLDPTRLADVADGLAARLAELDPEGAADYEARASALRDELLELDADLAAGLASCESTDIVTSHSAFGYLAERYGFEQVGISGLSPDTEPSPQDLARLADFVRANGVTTVYTETLVDRAIAEAVADESGATTAVLDPIEGLATGADGDYLSVMRENLQALRAGQRCR